MLSMCAREAISGTSTSLSAGLGRTPINEAAIRSNGKALKPRPERCLIIGWNRCGTTIVRELDNYVARGSQVTVVAEIANLEKQIRAQGMNTQYYHEIVGYNFRMTDMAAAIGLMLGIGIVFLIETLDDTLGAPEEVERELGLPILYAGLGEKPDDLEPFDPDAFVEGILA